jgi:DNA-binding MarR family transcriptional regulator
MTSQVLRALESRALLRRLPHPTDARARALTLTEEGRALADRAVKVVESCDAAFFAALGEEVPPFASSLRRLRDAADS